MFTILFPLGACYFCLVHIISLRGLYIRSGATPQHQPENDHRNVSRSPENYSMYDK